MKNASGSGIEQALEVAVESCESLGCPPRLAAAIRYAVFPGGARIRPRLCLAIAAGCGADFLESFLRGVFAEGIDAGSNRGLKRIASRAGLNATAVTRALEDSSWRLLAQQHRDRMRSLGLWGVPSLQVDDRPGLWGQDRLFMVEQDLATE